MFCLADQSQSVRPHERSGDEESEDGGELDSLKRKDDDASDQIDDQQFLEDFEMRHEK